ncbi:hypothetical protein SADUNF_Sadunf05G0072600 [Salix dunnii]|uniref:B-like cyclin n=1 Tax=Salix dunnii TaxID=1413687 RepID=A0A835KBX6_9ROSI|nr:hypothetical protein SADUNF_Sadunf05G0072600 [Salix dunnii]
MMIGAGYVFDRSKWRKVNARYHGITRSMIPDAPWTVLKLLRVGAEERSLSLTMPRERFSLHRLLCLPSCFLVAMKVGFEAYLVGGCVRDLLLNKAPKDFDVITTANLQQIKKKFHRAKIVGRRFPICIVLVKGSVIEVSSFETSAQQCREKEKALLSQMRGSCDEKDFLLWKNSMQRDFTVNSLFFDPFMNRIYDYANGMEDLRSLKLKTLIPAQLSFQEDCARILRGIRIAGRLGLSISKDTETAICILQSSVKSLNKDRIKMELNYMMSYGAAESTILLLQRFQLLKIFLPFHAAYLHDQADEVSARSSTMLMKLFYSLDKMVSSDRPCDCSLWVGLLAFHQALVLNPQNAFVIWAFASMLYCGTWQEGVKFARENAKVEGRFVPEISGFSEIKSDEKLAEEVSQLASLAQDAVDAFTDEISLSESLNRYLDPPFDVFVFVSKKIGEHVARLFHMQSCEYRREIFKIDYDLLVKGDLDETRFVMGKVILKTLSGGHVQGGKEIIKEELKVIKENHEPILSELAKDGCVVKKVKEHILSSFDEQKMEKAKQKEKVKMKCSSEQNINSMKEEVVLKDAHMEIAKKQLEVVDTMQVSEEKFLSPLQESDKKQVAAGNEERQHRAKKQRKKVEKVKHHELCYKETINIMKDEVVLKDAPMEIAKKHQKVADTTQVSKEKFRSPLQESDKKQVAVGNEERHPSAKKHRKMVEKVKHHELCYKETINSTKDEVVLKDAHMEIAKQQKVVDTTQVSEEKFHSPPLESDKKQLPVGNEERQHRAKKHRKMVEKVKHQEFCYKETKELFNVIRKCNPSEDEKIKGREEKDRPPVLQEMVKEKSVRSYTSALFQPLLLNALISVKSLKEKRREEGLLLLVLNSLVKFAAQLSGTQQYCHQELKKQKPSALRTNEFGDCIFVDVDKASSTDQPVPMFLEQTEARPDEMNKMEEVEMEDITEESILNIDDSDAKNPLAVVDYVEDLYDYYRKMEVLAMKDSEAENCSCVSPNYMVQQADINEKMRAILIDWLIEVHDKFDLMKETLFLTVNLIDRFLSQQTVIRKKLQLVGLVAMLLACKYEEVSVPVVGDLILISDKAYARKEVLEMENLMLNKLQFNMSVPTPYVFMQRFLKAAQSDKKLELLSFFLIELSLVEYEMLKFPPSLLAASAIYTAQRTIYGFKEWSRTCEWHSNYSEEQLFRPSLALLMTSVSCMADRECSRLMVGFHQKAGTGKLTGVYRKYNTSKFGFTSKCEAAQFL